MRWNCRKITAFALVTAIVIASAMSVSAEMETGSEMGIGRVEGTVNTDVYQVVLPTVGSHTFDFIMDPLELINQTDGAAYGGKTFEKDATLFFRNTDKGAKEDYSSISSPIIVKNRGSIPVEVSLNVSVDAASLGGIRMTSDRNFKGDTSASLYMAVVDGEEILPLGSDGVSITATLDPVPKQLFEYGYNKENKKYTYTLKKELSDDVFSARAFRLTGAVNRKGNWFELAEVSPEIRISWRITEKKE